MSAALSIIAGACLFCGPLIVFGLYLLTKSVALIEMHLGNVSRNIHEIRWSLHEDASISQSNGPRP